MMKKNKIFAIALTAIFGCGMISSCSSDNDEPEDLEIPSLPTPQYEATSAKYEIATSDSPWSSIELTASGDYIVTRSYSYWTDDYYSMKSSSTVGLLPRVAAGSRADMGNVIYGTYEKIGDNKYRLDGFGIVEITMDGDNAVSLTVTTSQGRDMALTAYKASSDANSPLTDAVCRSWNLDEIGMRLKLDKDMVFEGRRPASQVNSLMDDAGKAMFEYLKKRFPQMADDFDEEDMDLDFDLFEYAPTGLIFTKAGTYMVDYSGKALGVATWHWTNEKRGIFNYAWSYNDSGNYGGDAAVSFEGTTLVIREPHEGYDPELDMDIKSETRYFCSEKR